MRPGNWPNGAEAEEPLLGELHARAARGGPEPAVVGDRWNGWLLSRRDRLSPEQLAAALGARVRRGEGPDDLVRTELEAAAADPDRYRRRAEALFSQSAPTATQMGLIHDLAPGSVPPLRHVFDRLAEIVAGQGPVTAEQLKLCRKLVDRRLLEPGRRLESVLAHDEILGETLAALGREPAGDRIDELVKALAATDGRLLEARLDPVVAALLRPSALLPVERLLKSRPGLRDPYLRRLAAALRDEDRPELAVTAFSLLGASLRDDKRYREMVLKALEHWLMWVPEKRVKAAAEQISAVFSAAWVKAWTEFVEARAGRRKRYRMTHLFGGHS